MTTGRLALGASGEARAAAWYEARGYRVLARNWRVREGELDLVLARGSTVVFCEVKTRSSLAYGLPAEAVGPAKQRRLRSLALLWLRTARRAPAEIRFDVACVVGTNVEVIEAAF